LRQYHKVYASARCIFKQRSKINKSDYFINEGRCVMAIAVGMIETLGFPAVVEAADAMVKAARVTLVGYEKIGSGRVTVIVRGDVSEVQASVAAGVDSVKRVNGGQVLSTHIIARPHENLEYVLPIRYTEAVEQFRESVSGIRPYNRP
jgi:carbon dioxide concentrating mechanism protein CcmK